MVTLLCPGLKGLAKFAIFAILFYDFFFLEEQGNPLLLEKNSLTKIANVGNFCQRFQFWTYQLLSVVDTKVMEAWKAYHHCLHLPKVDTRLVRTYNNQISAGHKIHHLQE